MFVFLSYCFVVLLQKLHIFLEKSIALHDFGTCLGPLLFHKPSLLFLFLNQPLFLQFLCQGMAISTEFYILLINATFLSLKVKKYFSCSLMTVYWMFFCRIYKVFKKYWSKPDFLSLLSIFIFFFPSFLNYLIYKSKCLFAFITYSVLWILISVPLDLLVIFYSSVSSD